MVSAIVRFFTADAVEYAGAIAERLVATPSVASDHDCQRALVQFSSICNRVTATSGQHSNNIVIDKQRRRATVSVTDPERKRSLLEPAQGALVATRLVHSVATEAVPQIHATYVGLYLMCTPGSDVASPACISPHLPMSTA